MRLANPTASVLLALALTTTAAPLAEAAEAHGVDGAALGAVWAIPFVGILLSIAILPLAAPHFWHRHFGKVAAANSMSDAQALSSASPKRSATSRT